MKLKKRVTILIVALILVAGIGIFAYQKSNTRSEKNKTEKGHFIEIANTEDEIEYADISKAAPGDKVRLGDYEGEISWNVLAEQDGNLMLISTDCIAQRAYHDQSEDVTWKQCEMRKWLNETFYEKAFSQDEKAIILETKVSNPNNDAFSTKGGKDTRDYVYLLSIDEAKQYFLEASERMVTLRDGTTVWWWLRSPGFQQHDAANIGDYGTINTAGHKVFDTDVVNGGVRPVMWIRREK